MPCERSNTMITLDPKSTALVLIDLQKGILSRPLAPHSAADVVERAKETANRFRAAGSPVVLVHVGWSADGVDMPPQTVDEPIVLPAGGPPADFSEFAPGIAELGDVVVMKRQWGAFYGTELDLQLRRRGVRTIVLGGVATNFGVESTARAAWEHGYDLVVAEDLSTTMSAEMHEFAVRRILPRLGRVRAVKDIDLQPAR